MKSRFWNVLASAALALGVGMSAAAAQQQPIELKLAYFVGDQHAMSKWLIKWSEQLEKDSGGRIVFKRFPGSQMGPVQQHYDFARTGQADISWFLHGATPGRFPLTRGTEPCPLAGDTTPNRAKMPSMRGLHCPRPTVYEDALCRSLPS